MKVNEPIIENLETASNAYESALEINKNQKSVLEELKKDLHKYTELQEDNDGEKRRVITGEKFLQGFIDKFDEDIDREIISKRLGSIIEEFDENRTYRVHKLGRMIDKVDLEIEKNRRNMVENLADLESFRSEIEENYEAGSEHLPEDWTPSETYIGTEEHNCAPDVELFQSTLIEGNLTQTSITDHLENLEDSIEYLEEIIDYIQEAATADSINANETFYEDVADFTLPILDGLVKSLRMAKNEKQGLEHFLIHNDEHDYLLHRWKTILENDLLGSEWEVYGEEIDYFEDEDLTEKNRLPKDSDADFWRDGEFDLLLKNNDEFAYVEIKSFDGHAEESSTKQLDRIDDYESLLIQRNGAYERIDADNFRKFWANQKPHFDFDYAEQIEQASDDVTKLEGSGQVRNL